MSHEQEGIAGARRARMVARAAVIAGLYVVLALLPGPFSFGVPVGPFLVELRVAEALTVLPILYPEAVAAVFVGVVAANLWGGLGPWDVVGGSLVTLLAAFLTRRHRHTWLAYAWPVICNAVLISVYLSFVFRLPYWTTAVGIGLSEAAVVVAVGVPLVRLLKSRR